MPGMGIVGVVWLVGATCTLTQAPAITLDERDVRIKDVIDTSCLSIEDWSDISEMIVATLPTGSDEITISRSALRSLVGRRVPGLQLFDNNEDGQVLLQTSAKPSTASQARACMAASRFIRAGEIITQSALTPSACVSPARVPALLFDRLNRVTRATSDIAPGTALGALQAPRQVFETGDELSLSISIGSVHIERGVTAIQPGAGGDAIFVREANGDVISTPTFRPTPEVSNDR